MSMNPYLYGRKQSEASKAARAAWEARQPPCEYLVTWAGGSQTQAFRAENAALAYIDVCLRLVRDVTDAMLTGPEHEYQRCDCGCGRVYRDGTGNRLGRDVFAPYCPTYRNHPAVVGDTMASLSADDFNERRR